MLAFLHVDQIKLLLDTYSDEVGLDEYLLKIEVSSIFDSKVPVSIPFLANRDRVVNSLKTIELMNSSFLKSNIQNIHLDRI